MPMLAVRSCMRSRRTETDSGTEANEVDMPVFLQDGCQIKNLLRCRRFVQKCRKMCNLLEYSFPDG